MILSAKSGQRWFIDHNSGRAVELARRDHRRDYNQAKLAKGRSEQAKTAWHERTGK